MSTHDGVKLIVHISTFGVVYGIAKPDHLPEVPSGMEDDKQTS